MSSWCYYYAKYPGKKTRHTLFEDTYWLWWILMGSYMELSDSEEWPTVHFQEVSSWFSNFLSITYKNGGQRKIIDLTINQVKHNTYMLLCHEKFQ